MKKTRTAAFFGFVIASLTGCALHESKPDQTHSQPASPLTQHSGVKHGTDTSSDFPVIGRLEMRDRTITIKAGAAGTVYSVETREGKVLFENLSEEQLKAQAPELHTLIKTGIGRADASLKIDARW